MESRVPFTELDIIEQEPQTLISPANPNPTETVYLSNIDQSLLFPVQTIYFYEAQGSASHDIIEKVKKAISDVLLVSHYFMAGRLHFNGETQRVELVCNNAGVLFVGATSTLRLEDLGDVSMPNTLFNHLLLKTDASKSLDDTPLFTVQVTRFKCGGFSVGFVTNHSILDGRAAVEMFQNLAAICRGQSIRANTLILDRTFLKARNPPQIKFQHYEYISLEQVASFSTSFTSHSHPTLSDRHSYRRFSFTASMIATLKQKSSIARCSSFEAMVAHIWRKRTAALFNDSSDMSSVIFPVDIRSKTNPPLPPGFVGNGNLATAARAKVEELKEKPFSFCVEKVREAIERVSDDEYVRSAMDWLETHKGVPATVNGGFFMSAWWKLPFHKLDFGHGKPVYGGPVVSGMEEFVLLLADRKNDGGIGVWIMMEKGKMERFEELVYDF